MKQTLVVRNISTAFEGENESPEESVEFFNELFVEMCREISLSAIYKEFHLLPPFLRLFNVFELFFIENQEEYRKKHPKLSSISKIYYTLNVSFYPKASKEANILEISLEAHSFTQGVFQDFFTTPKTFKIRIDKYART